jgi:hypothetical protein
VIFCYRYVVLTDYFVPFCCRYAAITA